MSLGVWCDICGAFDQDMLSHLKIHSEQKRVIELRTSISGENTTKKECDHIVGYCDVLKEQYCCGSFLWETDLYKMSQVGNITEGEDCEYVVFKYCPECGEKLNLKKDE